MSMLLLTTKLYMAPPRPKAVLRTRLTERLNDGMRRKLTLVSASAGSGKTTLVSQWLSGFPRPAAWLSLEEADNDPARFLNYLFAAMRTVEANVGDGAHGMLQSPQPPPMETVITALLNDVAAIPRKLVLVLDDYHVITAEPVHDALAFLVEHMPEQMHLVIATREEPRLSLAKLRVRDQLTEVRAADLRFTASETAEFLGQVMGLSLSAEDVAFLEDRTEGWIAGLQLAALSIRRDAAAAGLIETFGGSRGLVPDYLVEEVLQRQPAAIQTFLLRTSILDRMCGPLCDAVLREEAGDADRASGQDMLEYLERANLFVVPLDDERRWYRYHHLFAELLRQRQQRSSCSPAGSGEKDDAALHLRASGWYEANGLELDAFRHAVAAGDVERAARLIEGRGMPLHFRGIVAPVRSWLESLHPSVMNAKPSLWVIYASVLLTAGETTGVEAKLQAAEAALQAGESGETARDLAGHIASIRATMAVSRHRAEDILYQSRLALANLSEANLPVRTATTWALGYAYQLKGDRASALQAYREAAAVSRQIGHIIIRVMAETGLGQMQEAGNLLELAAQTYRHVLQLAGEDSPLPAVCEAYLGLARIHCEWNDLDAAERYGERSLALAPLIENTDRVVACELFFARLSLAKGDAPGAAARAAKAERLSRLHNFAERMPEIDAVRVQALLRQGDAASAGRLARTRGLILGMARACLAAGDTPGALAAIEPMLRQAEEKEWADERLRLIVLKAVVLDAHGEKGEALSLLAEALTLAEPGGFIRVFVDEGLPMAELLGEAAARSKKPDYIKKLLANFPPEEGEGGGRQPDQHSSVPAEPLMEPLSERELQVLRLIAEGRSNREIGDRLFLALSTVKGYNQQIFGKLQVRRRTEAVARARSLGLL
ncbi:LuxR C-terminal-related transcriptional regulator [Paenibacillus arenilitoris]|uniref:LuxR family transcriptional regulator n=1 Tax=Paenibacillus arenilitoris TaxID=2772299 RepID=A0A927H4B1_9BACL|nr:LuxR C-terminal-related transcriptional regulator [Paenibacillus arenilitoris]MBD2867288.1 LuxR family transcriptional regulator [Paenibacillus arenilitoris]